MRRNRDIGPLGSRFHFTTLLPLFIILIVQLHLAAAVYFPPHNITFASPHIRAPQSSTLLKNPYYNFNLSLNSSPLQIYRTFGILTSQIQQTDQQQKLQQLLYLEPSPIAVFSPTTATESDTVLTISTAAENCDFELISLTVEIPANAFLSMKLKGSNGQLSLIGAIPDTNWWYDEWLEDPVGGLDDTPRRARLPGVSGTGEDWGIGWKRMKWVKIWAGWSEPGGVWESDSGRAGWNGTAGVAGSGLWGIDEILVRKRCD